MPISDHVSLTITQGSVGVKRAGFGTPCILSHSAAWATDRTRSYTSLTAVGVDFATTSVEYLCSQAIFSQTPKPAKIKIARANDSGAVPTKIFVLTPTAVHSATYTVTIAGPGMTTTEVSYTADSATTVAEITAGLTTAVNGVTGNNYIAADNSTNVSVTGDAAGDWFSIACADPALLNILETTAAPANLATTLDAIVLVDPDWYCLLTNFNSEAYADAVWTWVESQKKIYMFDTNDTDSVTVAVGSGDTLDQLATENRTRTAGWYHPSPADFLAASIAGRFLPIEPGSITAKFKTLSGPAPVVLTSTQYDNLIAKSANSYYTAVTGSDITFAGTMGDGGFIDTKRNLDWIEDDVSKSVYEVLTGNDIVPFTDGGVNAVKGAILGSLKRAVQKGILAADPKPVVSAPLVADVSTANKSARILPDVEFSGTMAGAIHEVVIDGVVSL